MKRIFTLFIGLSLLLGQYFQTQAQVATHIVISEVYGGGGNGGAVFKNDFIELYNPTSSPVSLAGMSIQYTSAAGVFSASNITKLTTGTIASHGYFLVQEAAGTGTAPALPTPDFSDTLKLSATNGKLALVSDQVVLTTADFSGANPSASRIIDFIGYGTATNYEGASAVAALSNTTSAERKASASSTAVLLATGGADALAGNGWDSNVNSADFVNQTAVTPQNSSSTHEPMTVTNPVTSITVSGTGSATTITTSAGTLQMLAAVLPANADVQAVAWSVASVTGNASISVGGLLTAMFDGIVTVKATATDGSNVFGTLDITISGQTQSTIVSNIAALRASATGATIYKLTSTAILTFQQTSRNQKYIQDATGGILIDDATGKITTAYNQYDGITNILGTLTDYNGMLEFVPSADPGASVSQGNTVTPIPLTLAEMNDAATFLSHQAQLVKISNVTFGATGTFATGKGYAITSSVDSFYTNFYNVNYIGQTIPATTVNIIGILGTRTITGNFITARSIADIEGMSTVSAVETANEISAYPNPARESITITNINNVTKIEISNILGQVVSSYANLPKDMVTLKLNGFNKGIYFISLIEKDRIVKTMKFTKE